MCCPIVLIAFFGARTALVFLWLTGYLYASFQNFLWPVLGFIFMPYTTLAYAIAMHNGGLDLFWQIVLGIAVITDLSVHGGSAREGRARKRSA